MLQRRLAWDKGTVRVGRGLDDAKAWSGKPFTYTVADDAFDGYVDRFKVSIIWTTGRGGTFFSRFVLLLVVVV